MTPKITRNKELYDQLCKLLRHKEIYDIVCALRGPDRTDEGTQVVKEWTAARLRGLFGLDEVVGTVTNEPLTKEGHKIIFEGRKLVGYHYMAHYESACRAFRDLFGYDPAVPEDVEEWKGSW